MFQKVLVNAQNCSMQACT